jgi:hypothetical protein
MPSLETFYENIQRLKSAFSSKYNIVLEDSHIFDALFMLIESKFNLELPSDLIDIDFTFEEAKKLLENFDFDILLHNIETNSDLISDCQLMQKKVRVKDKGIVWVIHKYDADPFPSNPHAHQVDNNIKLDLSNGNMYLQTIFLKTISKKDLLSIRQKASLVYNGILPTLSK